MKKSKVQTIGEALDAFFENNPELLREMAETRLFNSWGTIVGKLALRYTGEMYVRKRTLYVRINSSVLKSELMMIREQLVRKLNDAAELSVIDTIVFL